HGHEERLDAIGRQNRLKPIKLTRRQRPRVVAVAAARGQANARRHVLNYDVNAVHGAGLQQGVFQVEPDTTDARRSSRRGISCDAHDFLGFSWPQSIDRTLSGSIDGQDGNGYLMSSTTDVDRS